MTQPPDQSADERWKQREERSRLFLEEIDQLDDALAATVDKKLRGKLQRQRKKSPKGSQSIWTTETV